MFWIYIKCVVFKKLLVFYMVNYWFRKISSLPNLNDFLFIMISYYTMQLFRVLINREKIFTKNSLNKLVFLDFSFMNVNKR